MTAIADIAAALRQAEETATPCGPVRDMLPGGGGLAEAYAIQAANRDHWMKDGRRLVGRKVALSAKGAQAAMGISEPAFGMLYADMLLGDGDEVAKGRVLQPRLEGEVAIVLDHDLDMEHPTWPTPSAPSATACRPSRSSAAASPIWIRRSSTWLPTMPARACSCSAVRHGGWTASTCAAWR